MVLRAGASSLVHSWRRASLALRGLFACERVFCRNT